MPTRMGSSMRQPARPLTAGGGKEDLTPHMPPLLRSDPRAGRRRSSVRGAVAMAERVARVAEGHSARLAAVGEGGSGDGGEHGGTGRRRRRRRRRRPPTSPAAAAAAAPAAAAPRMEDGAASWSSERVAKSSSSATHAALGMEDDRRATSARAVLPSSDGSRESATEVRKQLLLSSVAHQRAARRAVFNPAVALMGGRHSVRQLRFWFDRLPSAAADEPAVLVGMQLVWGPPPPPQAARSRSVPGATERSDGGATERGDGGGGGDEEVPSLVGQLHGWDRGELVTFDVPRTRLLASLTAVEGRAAGQNAIVNIHLWTRRNHAGYTTRLRGRTVFGEELPSMHGDVPSEQLLAVHGTLHNSGGLEYVSNVGSIVLPAGYTWGTRAELFSIVTAGPQDVPLYDLSIVDKVVEYWDREHKGLTIYGVAYDSDLFKAILSGAMAAFPLVTAKLGTV
eukprot:PLAT12508.10.p1 GENE.PLAT12508.10~~PLAT12508.10.p1  ORF type:complete len:452 (-),score=188.01 PLAT12508.10:989-2344(-)